IYVVPTAGGREVSITTGIALGGQANLAWSPDSRFIAFENDDDIWVVGRDGQNLRRLTHHPATDSGPVWSPDGTRIAFFADRNGNSEIYVVNADGTGLANLTKTPDDEFKPAWSPDGWSIAYLRAERKDEPDYETTLWSMGANGADQHRLGTFTGHGLSAPAWSPDSRQIAVIAAPEGSDLADGTIANGQLVVIAANGAGQRVIHEHAAGLGRPVWRPLWWPEEMSGDPDAPDPLVPHLTLVPAEGSCATQAIARGSGFEPGAVVSLYGAPAPGGGFDPVTEAVIVAADGSFETPLDLTRFAGCAGAAPTSGQFQIGAAIERGQQHGAALADLSASAVFTVRE
ncbi:MAG: TolB family protein, partial [Vicinamibacterales bacterium]